MFSCWDILRPTAHGKDFQRGEDRRSNGNWVSLLGPFATLRILQPGFQYNAKRQEHHHQRDQARRPVLERGSAVPWKQPNSAVMAVLQTF